MSYFYCTTQECGTDGLLDIGEYYVEAVDFDEAVEMVEHVFSAEVVPVVGEGHEILYHILVYGNRSFSTLGSLIVEFVPVDWDMTDEEISSSIRKTRDQR
jgi:hypothetical protein